MLCKRAQDDFENVSKVLQGERAPGLPLREQLDGFSRPVGLERLDNRPLSELGNVRGDFPPPPRDILYVIEVSANTNLPNSLAMTWGSGGIDATAPTPVISM